MSRFGRRDLRPARVFWACVVCLAPLACRSLSANAQSAPDRAGRLDEPHRFTLSVDGHTAVFTFPADCRGPTLRVDGWCAGIPDRVLMDGKQQVRAEDYVARVDESGLTLELKGEVAAGSRLEARLFWSTTFECNDWKQSEPRGALRCDGLEKGGDWHVEDHLDQIITEANHPGGAGGKGFRHWQADGRNRGGGGIRYRSPVPLPEFWVRWYMRYEKGFRWANGVPQWDKLLYIHTVDHGSSIVGFADGVLALGNYHGPGRHAKSKHGWTDIMGGRESDGQWHCYEAHLKLDTNGADGVVDIWIDGEKALRREDQDFKGHEKGGKGWRILLIGSNQNCPANGRPMYQDYDDIAISTTGRIGPLPPRRARARESGVRPEWHLPSCSTTLNVGQRLSGSPKAARRESFGAARNCQRSVPSATFSAQIHPSVAAK
jgi:hypothetical protein